MGISDNILKIFFTNTCPICGETIPVKKKGICDTCKKEIRYVREPRCRKCGRPLYDMEEILCAECVKGRHKFDAGVCIFEHSGKIRKSIYDFKYENRREHADFYGREAVRIYGRTFTRWHVDRIVPVPVHKDKERKRGYNQAQVFAEAVARYTEIPVDDKLIVRKKKTIPQKELTESMRYQNLKNAFAIDKGRMEGIRNVLIVDDIYTTGSTMDACSAILKKAGAVKVYFLCISAGMGV